MLQYPPSSERSGPTRPLPTALSYVQTRNHEVHNCNIVLVYNLDQAICKHHHFSLFLPYTFPLYFFVEHPICSYVTVLKMWGVMLSFLSVYLLYDLRIITKRSKMIVRFCKFVLHTVEVYNKTTLLNVPSKIEPKRQHEKFLWGVPMINQWRIQFFYYHTTLTVQFNIYRHNGYSMTFLWSRNKAFYTRTT